MFVLGIPVTQSVGGVEQDEPRWTKAIWGDSRADVIQVVRHMSAFLANDKND